MDVAILSIGVRPELKLARESHLHIGEAGGIFVDDQQQTSDPSIYAAGDAVETVHIVTGKRTRIPLAGPANKTRASSRSQCRGRGSSIHRSLGYRHRRDHRYHRSQNGAIRKGSEGL